MNKSVALEIAAQTVLGSAKKYLRAMSIRGSL